MLLRLLADLVWFYHLSPEMVLTFHKPYLPGPGQLRLYLMYNPENEPEDLHKYISNWKQHYTEMGGVFLHGAVCLSTLYPA